jgi:hypothetical protein
VVLLCEAFHALRLFACVEVPPTCPTGDSVAAFDAGIVHPRSTSSPKSSRQNADLSNVLRLIWDVQMERQKYSSSNNPKYMDSWRRSAPDRGALRDRHERWKRNAMDTFARKTSATEADGEAVWSRRRDAGAKLVGDDPARRRGQESPFPEESTV